MNEVKEIWFPNEHLSLDTTSWEVRYMCGGEGELLSSGLSYENAQLCVRVHADGMHEEQAADLVIRAEPTEILHSIEDAIKCKVEFGDDYDMYCGYCDQFTLTTEGERVVVIPVSWEVYVGDMESDVPFDICGPKTLMTDEEWEAESKLTHIPTITTKDEPMNTTRQIGISLEDVNKSSLLSTMAAEMFKYGLNPRLSLITATAWMGAIDHLDDIDVFMEALFDGLTNTGIDISEIDEQPNDEIDGLEIMKALADAHYLETTDSPCLTHSIPVMGSRFNELLELRREAYAPLLASEGVANRRFGYADTKYSNLYKEATHALEATEYTVDEWMLGICKQVVALTGGTDNDKEGYVIKGCEAMSGDLAYVSEFKGDLRLRLYQACCQGPNGQSSDRSRALMDLHGVPMDYDVNVVMPVLKHELSDMVNVEDSGIRAQLVKDAVNDPVGFIVHHLGLKESEDDLTIVSKPFNFVKGARMLVALHKGERPYLGMAAGLDAKCSGPQLGALMVGDQYVAAACGFSLEKTDKSDAYYRALAECEKAGIHGMTREDIKTPYMGIFYGQGFKAFLDPSEMTKGCWNALHGEGEILGNEERAKAFHKAVSASFGKKMVSVRNAVKAYGKITEGKTSHYMPDGSLVAMNYKQQVNVLGEAIGYDTVAPDVHLHNNEESYKFIGYTMNTKEIHQGDFARKGFVNMVQATDAMLARLIIVHLKRMGAQHIICVHDCFRVNMAEMHILEAAIKQAYADLFGTAKNVRTKDLPMGTDILGMYFEGANKVLKEGEKPRMITQFFASGTRRLQKIGGIPLISLIKALGKSYYFAK